MKKLYTTLLFSCLISFVANAQTQLTVRGFSQGYYNSTSGKLNAVLDPVNYPLICDTGTIELIDVNTNTTVQCIKTPINTDGFATVSIPGSFTGQSYKVSIKFKNTYHLLSASPMLMNGQPSQCDLTILQNTCCNYDTTHGVAKAYSGDVNYDGLIDVMDLTIWESDYHNNPTGYHLTDVNGDQVVDTVDLMIMETNSNMGNADDYFSNCSPSIATNINGLDELQFGIYPNPAADEIYIYCNAASGDQVEIVFFDVTGREVKREYWNQDGRGKVDISSLTSGVYVVSLFGSNGPGQVRRIVKE